MESIPKGRWHIAYVITLSLAMLWSLTIGVVHAICVFNEIRVSHIGLYPLVFVIEWLGLVSMLICGGHIFAAYKNQSMSENLWIINWLSVVFAVLVLCYVWLVAY